MISLHLNLIVVLVTYEISLRELVWVCKEDFEDYYEEGCVGNIMSSITRYEFSEIFLTESYEQYELYKDIFDTYPF